MAVAEPTVLLAGGGTAGHVNPLLALAAEIKQRFPQVRLRALGTEQGLEADLIPAAGIELVNVPKVPFPRRPSKQALQFPAKLRHAITVATHAAREADVVVGFGGYVATPAYLGARRAGVPIVVHEQNARPGLANRLGARFAAAVAVTFAGTKLPEATVVGLPLRPAITELIAARRQDANAARVAAAQRLGLDPTRQILLVSGGSLGAVSLNQAVSAAAGEILDTQAQVIHLTGTGKDGQVRSQVTANVGETSDYHVLAYLEQMQDALACADLVLCRSGAGTVCELSALGIPAIYVPLPIGNGEQRLNASGVVTAGGGILVDDDDLTPRWVAREVADLLSDSDRLHTMATRAAAVGVRDGAQRLADLVHVAAGWNS